MSVHLQNLTSWKYIPNVRVVEEMDFAITVCGAVLSVRKSKNLKVKLELPEVTLCVHDGVEVSLETLNSIKSEVNAASVVLENNFKEMVSVKEDINFALLGKRAGTGMKSIVKDFKSGNYTRNPDGSVAVGDFTILPEELNAKYEPQKSLMPYESFETVMVDGCLIILNTHITQSAVEKSIARDLIRVIQEMRKNTGFNVQDRISCDISIDNSGENADLLLNSLSANEQYIKEQVLCTQYRISQENLEEHSSVLENCKISIKLTLNTN